MGRSIFVPLNEEQEVYIVGDIHGCLKTFRSLLSTIGYNGKSPLFLLGDYINKGPKSRETLDFIIELKQCYPRIYPLLGNHDTYLLAFLTRTDPEWLQSAQYTLMRNSGAFNNITPTEKSRYINIIGTLPLFYETEAAYLVHAGFNFELEDVFADEWAMLNIRKFAYDSHKVGGKKVIHGHLPAAYYEIENAVLLDLPVLPLDNGCVYEGEREGMGTLCCLELKKMKLFAQRRID